MIFHENHLLADDSHVYHALFLSKIRKDVADVVCCSRDWHFDLYSATIIFVLKMLPAIYICSIYSSALKASFFVEANTFSPD